MLPGPTLIKRCKECSGLIAEDTIMSGNTFGATYWTDGKCEAPMLPDSPWLVVCPHCRAPLWLDEQEQVGQREPFSKDDAFRDARLGEEPTVDEYLRVLERERRPQQERYLRFRVWWGGNDARRGTAASAPLSAKEAENLETLAAALDIDDDNDRIAKAEIMRELGRFDDATELLAAPFERRLSAAAAAISALVRKKSWDVTEMRLDDDA